MPVSIKSVVSSGMGRTHRPPVKALFDKARKELWSAVASVGAESSQLLEPLRAGSGTGVRINHEIMKRPRKAEPMNCLADMT